MKTFDPKKFLIVVGAATMGGFADGTFITAERDEATWSKKTGADGETARNKTNNRAGKFTLTLMASSDSNDVLSALAILDELNNDGVFPIVIKDLLGRTVCAAGQAWITMPAKIEAGKELGDREWVIDSGPIEFFVGGSNA